MRVKIITDYNKDDFEAKLNSQIQELRVIDIKYSCSKAMSAFETLEMYSAMVLYDD